MPKDVRVIVRNVDDPIGEDRIAFMVHTVMKANKISTDVEAERIEDVKAPQTAEEKVREEISKRAAKAKAQEAEHAEPA